MKLGLNLLACQFTAIEMRGIRERQALQGWPFHWHARPRFLYVERECLEVQFGQREAGTVLHPDAETRSRRATDLDIGRAQHPQFAKRARGDRDDDRLLGLERPDHRDVDLVILDLGTDLVADFGLGLDVHRGGVAAADPDLCRDIDPDSPGLPGASRLRLVGRGRGPGHQRPRHGQNRAGEGQPAAARPIHRCAPGCRSHP
ncbi:MAG: hypothetical protein R3E83_02740 [Burkholderiaceae bacterium]